MNTDGRRWDWAWSRGSAGASPSRRGPDAGPGFSAREGLDQGGKLRSLALALPVGGTLRQQVQAGHGLRGARLGPGLVRRPPRALRPRTPNPEPRPPASPAASSAFNLVAERGEELVGFGARRLLRRLHAQFLGQARGLHQPPGLVLQPGQDLVPAYRRAVEDPLLYHLLPPLSDARTIAPALSLYNKWRKTVVYWLRIGFWT